MKDLCCCTIIPVIGILGLLWVVGSWLAEVPPTEDQLYGCTPAQQAPNGDCK